MSTYTIYNKIFAPEALLNRHPNAPEYHDDSLEGSNTIMLFVTTLEDVTGTPAENIAYINQTEEELSNEALDLMIDGLLTGEPSSTEYQVLKSRGRYLYETRFKQEAE